MTGKEMQSALSAADVRITEAAIIFRVAQTTVRRWYKDETTPKQPVTFEIACKMTKLIEKATQKGVLPVKDVKGKERLVAIRAAIRDAVNY